MRFAATIIKTISFCAAFAGFTQTAFALESREYRKQKNLYLLGEYGSAVVPIRTAGFVLGMIAAPDLSFELTYAEGEKDVKYAEMNAKLYSLRAKKFWANSFYTTGGFAYRAVEDRTTDKVSEMFYVERHGKSAGLDFAVGNQWQFDNISIGCDWVGWFQPLTVARKEAFVPKVPGFGAHGPQGKPGPGGPEQGGVGVAEEPTGHGPGATHGKSYDKHQNDWDRLSKHGTLQLLRLSLGVVF